ncbi:MarR family winged helix-turn-helix transcriptional regulator [Nocardioides solisilvae]|uniref:MarR family winged helix-turn-helix transcriptional regulator n=1 Tax=Nocardioides solisilvae TaxID=1542435 RepID=UPI000D74BD26|nr:MarR family transcriptional regulator [Nocardioides solisilvae]
MHPAVLMQVAHRHVERRVLARAHERGFADLTTAQARVAARIDEEGTRLTVLAERAGTTKQSAGELVAALERGGYVRRVPDPADARARLVRLAERGERARTAAREVEREVLGEWEERLGPVRFAALREALADLRELTDD